MRAIAACFLVLLFLLPAGWAGAQSLPAEVEVGPIDVIDIEGPVDSFTVDFAIASLAGAAEDGAQAVILKIDSPAAVVDLSELLAAVRTAPMPVVAWVGDAPAVAFGGALELVASADIRVAAPSVRIGYSAPLILGGNGQASTDISEAIEVVGPVPGVVDELAAALGPLIVSLDGRSVDKQGTVTVLETAEDSPLEDGSVRQRVIPQIRFLEPGLMARTMRLPLQPEAAFFFLVVGLTLVAFEFFAIGPGVAAGTAVLPLFLAGYGLVVLPIAWGLAAALVAMWLLTVDFQRGGFGAVSYAATGLLFLGGMFLTDSRPQLPPSWWTVLLTTGGVALFYMFAMPTVARARFTTPTIGREYLIGKRGVALTDPSSDGALSVEVDGATWSAVCHREAAIQDGDPVVVESIRGLFLEVRPVTEAASPA